MEIITMDTLQTLFFGLVASGLTYWVKSLHSAIDDLRRENIRFREYYQLKSDAVRDQEQIMGMLTEIKQSLDRVNARIDRQIDGNGSR